MTKHVLTSLREGRKVRFESPDELLSILSEVYNGKIVILRMEAFKRRGDDEIADTEHSIINLDGDENWRNHKDVDRMFDLLKRKIAEMRHAGKNYVLNVWAEPWPQSSRKNGQISKTE